MGNTTVTNPKMRNFLLFSENVSLCQDVLALRRPSLREFDAVRLEGFNVFNRVQFSTPNTNLSSSSFGLVTGQANAPRNVQLALKFLF